MAKDRVDGDAVLHGSSIDGFTADPEHSLSWLLTRQVDRNGPMSHERACAGFTVVQ